jgi:hypothetical protein
VALRFIYTPHPVVGMPASVLQGYIKGKDPGTQRNVIDEVIEALTKPVGDDDRVADFAPAQRTGIRQAFLESDTEDNLQSLFFERGWTDGLPIILPTEERVAEMLQGTGRPPDEVVAEIYLHDTQENLKFTVEMVAIIGVMAGARPAHLPVLLAVASTGHPSIPGSTTPFACMLLVNGPIRNEIGMNSGIGAFSPRNLANSVIGRAWTLLTIHWGYFRLKKQFWSSQGNPIGYNNMCVAENEERSAWEPFHVQKKFRADESVISLFRGWSFVNNVVGSSQRSVGEDMFLHLTALPGAVLGSHLDSGSAGGAAFEGKRRLPDQAGFLPLDLAELQDACRAILGYRSDRHVDGSCRQSGRGAVRVLEEAAPGCAHRALRQAGKHQHRRGGRRNKPHVEGRGFLLRDKRFGRQVACAARDG